MYQELETRDSPRTNMGLEPSFLHCGLDMTLFKLEGSFGGLYSNLLLKVLLSQAVDQVSCGFL